MSRSPSEAVTGSEADDYYRAFEATYRLHAEGHSFSGRERHCTFLNLGDGQEREASVSFADVSAVTGLDLLDDGRAVAAVDWDFDGDLDLWTSNRTAPQLRFLRNELPPDGRFVAALLEGRTVNRDAVGARVELHLRDGGEQVSLIRSRHAGHGFLGQSSSWIHFGVGRADAVERLLVRWPGGATETFDGVEIGGRYRLVEGSGVAEPWNPSSTGGELSPAVVPPREPSTPPRAMLASTPPSPRLSYRDWDGSEAVVESSGPVLLNLWASWCLPCYAEMKEIGERASELRSAGLAVIAASVDGLDADKGTGKAEAEAFLDRFEFPFPTGFATPSLLGRLQLLLDLMFSRKIPLTVPTSLLIDGDGRLAAIYRGRVEVDQLLDDVRHLGGSVEQRRARATPFDGRWFAPPRALSMTTVARRFAEEGFLDDAGSYLRSALEVEGETAEIHLALGDLMAEQKDPVAADRHYRAAIRLDPGNAAAHRKLADLLAARGALDEALGHYSESLALESGDAGVRFNYGNALQALGRADEALLQYREAVKLDPDLADAHNNLAALLLQRSDFDAAIVHLRETLRLKPDLASAHNNLGILLLQRGQTRDAVEHFERAVALDPQDAGFRTNLEIARQRVAGSSPK